MKSFIMPRSGTFLSVLSRFGVGLFPDAVVRIGANKDGLLGIASVQVRPI